MHSEFKIYNRFTSYYCDNTSLEKVYRSNSTCKISSSNYFSEMFFNYRSQYSSYYKRTIALDGFCIKNVGSCRCHKTILKKRRNQICNNTKSRKDSSNEPRLHHYGLFEHTLCFKVVMIWCYEKYFFTFSEFFTHHLDDNRSNFPKIH